MRSILIVCTSRLRKTLHSALLPSAVTEDRAELQESRKDLHDLRNDVLAFILCAASFPRCIFLSSSADQVCLHECCAAGTCGVFCSAPPLALAALWSCLALAARALRTACSPIRMRVSSEGERFARLASRKAATENVLGVSSVVSSISSVPADIPAVRSRLLQSRAPVPEITATKCNLCGHLLALHRDNSRLPAQLQGVQRVSLW